MTREEFMKHAEAEIDQAFRGHKNRMMNLVEQAWAEGKRNAEIDGVTSIVKGVLDKLSEENKEKDGCIYYKGRRLTDAESMGMLFDDPPDDEWVPFALPWVEGRCIPEKRMSLKDGKWIFESRYPKPSVETDDEDDEDDEP